MVNARMEDPERSPISDVMDRSSDDRTKEVSSDSGECLKQTWDLLAFSGTCQAGNAATPPPLALGEDRLEGVHCRNEPLSEKSIPVLMQNNFEVLHPELGHPVSQSLDFSERFGQPLEPIENLKTQDKCSNDATQSVFWAGILQAQMCFLDLQEELDRQKEPLQTCGVNSESLDTAIIDEPLLLESDTEEEPEENLEKDEEESEEEEEEEEVECLFFNNPLFQESPHLTRTFEGQVPWSQPERETSTENYEKKVKSEVDAGNHNGALFSQANAAMSPVARNYFSVCDPDANEHTSSYSFPSYVPHYRSFSPLLITEKDLEITCSLAEDSEDEDLPREDALGSLTGSPPRRCFLDPLPGEVLESLPPEPSAYLPAEGLLFSASSTSLMSALLQEPTKSYPPAQPTPPGGSCCITSNFQVPSAPAAEQNLQQERSEPQASPHGHPSSSCIWLEEPERTSSLQKDVSGADVCSIPLCGVERKRGGSVERLKMVELPAMQSDGRPKGGEEEPMLYCPEEPAGEFGRTGGSLPAKVPAEPNGTLLLANGTSGDLAGAHRLAARLYHLDGFRKSQVAAFLRKNNTFSQMVAEAYLSFFRFSEQTLDQALRSFLKSFVLTGETQERERILMHFSQRYHCCNPEASLSPDAVHTLTCAMMLLNTDLHGQDEQHLEMSGSEELIGVSHALAEKASKYTKRPHVFRLQTADWHIFLFQAPTPEEMTSWISRINLVAAMFSAPPFPAAVGSQKKFIRPILPITPCKNSIEDQHLAHESCMDRVAHELMELQRNLPEKRGRGRDLEEYQLRKEYLLYEKRRYETYVKLLEVKLGCSSDDLDQWEVRLAAMVESCPSLQKSHSSPSLNVEGPPAGGAKVKRNISERRTVRRIIPKRNRHLL
ncbi:PREDICTED: PH and SEC7 domain-containing protein 4-like [Thamnophis sirtalis]|uniref:PH and SEC7 domain-containing protein 4-like n=1 Tax=Thamnophis sirtalis TaxID=35019 RepID=A0A6I9Z698_9SAUR|nr:PREDICTED: PH and SEC7 domain-containing protein 4-like [Thamnophis sirtalis]